MNLSLNLSIYILHEFFHIFTDKDLLETMTILIFGPFINPNMLNLLNQPAKTPTSYSSQWNFRNFWDEYLEKQNEKDSPLKKSDSFDSDDEKKIKSDPVALFFFKTKNSKSIQLNDLKNIYKNDIFNYEKEHKRLSSALGVLTTENIENPDEILKKNPLFLSKSIRENLKIINKTLNSPELLKNEFEINPLRDVFLKFFTVFYMYINTKNFVKIYGLKVER